MKSLKLCFFSLSLVLATGAAHALMLPDLYSLGISSFAVTNNTGVANETAIQFPDGQIRRATEDVASAHKYRCVTMTSTAIFNAGSVEDSGFASGEKEAVNTWYTCYAVKSASNTAKFVLAITTHQYVQSEYSWLNTKFSTNGWVCIGLVPNGNAANATSDIPSFRQHGNMTIFNNSVPSANALGAEQPKCGLLYFAASSNNPKWTYAAGTVVGTSVPSNITFISWVGVMAKASGGWYVGTSEVTSACVGRLLLANASNAAIANERGILTSFIPASEGIAGCDQGGNTLNSSFLLYGFIDGTR